MNVLHVFETCLLDISGSNMYRVSSTKTACPLAQLRAVKKFKIAVFSNPDRKPMLHQVRGDLNPASDSEESCAPEISYCTLGRPAKLKNLHGKIGRRVDLARVRYGTITPWDIDTRVVSYILCVCTVALINSAS